MTDIGHGALSRFSVVIEFENSHERFGRYLHATELPHTFFTLFLLFEQFFLTGHVAAVALRKNIFTHRLDRFARYDLTAYRRLYGYFKQLARYDLFELFREYASARLCLVAVYDYGERVADFAV